MYPTQGDFGSMHNLYARVEHSDQMLTCYERSGDTGARTSDWEPHMREWRPYKQPIAYRQDERPFV